MGHLFNQEQNNRTIEAYERMQEHVAKNESFEEFVLYFESITHEQDPKRVKEWLLRILHLMLQRENDARGEQFLKLLTLVGEEQSNTLTQWLYDQLDKKEKQ